MAGEERGTALIEAPQQPALPAPLFSGAEMGEAMQAYRGLQLALDKAMPDQLMRLSGKVFRKKGYWRAVAKAFSLRLTLITESRYEEENGDWGYLACYRAEDRNGNAVDSDGSCAASEKVGRDGSRAMCTTHNVRAHAHTRAKNRAIADLVGFGEVSAEEMRDDQRDDQRWDGPARSAPPPRKGGGPSEKQLSRLFAISREHGWSNEQVRELLSREFQLESTSDLSRGQYDKGCNELLPAGPAVEGEVGLADELPF